MKETKTTYAYLIEHMREPSFEKVRELACDFVQKLPSELVDELHEMLNRGVDILESEPLMQMYFYSYGCMHAEKLAFAFKHLNHYIKSAKEIDLIDYGCGQGLATMCYHDFILNNSLPQQVRSITLIEPSSVALARAELLCACFFPNAVITSIQKPFDELLVTDIQMAGDVPTLHLFSNILDVESFNVKSLSDIIKASYKGDNEFIIVSPMQHSRRIGRLKDFVENLGIDCYLEKFLDKRQLREDKDWTCLAILCSTRNVQLAAVNIDEVYAKVDRLFQDITKRRNKDYCEQVFDEVKFCAENGDAKSINTIGRFYSLGIGVQKDYSEALRWYKIASEHGYIPAICNIALAYIRGRGVDKNLEKAIVIANELQNNPMLFNAVLGDIYRFEENRTLAFDYYKNAAQLGDPKSEFFYGAYLYEGKVCKHNKKLGVRYIRSAAKKGVGAANFIMARLYESGADDVEIEQSDNLAVKNYKVAAMNGNKKAQLKLAEIYKDGLLGVKKSPKESFKWYLLLGESGDVSVAFNVAYAYENGNGTKVNYEEAVKWYKIAANNGSVAAMNNLGRCYEKGEGIEKNLETAFSLYYESASLGNLVAANNLSICYQNGIGTEVNPKEAFIWKEKVANDNHSKAQKTLSEWCFKGYGTQRNYERALYWFVISICDDRSQLKEIQDVINYIKARANEEDPFFQYLLAKCYDRGVGVPKNKSESKFWYEASADNNFVESLIKLHRINVLSTGVTKQELANGKKDEYGVIYSCDWKKVLSCSYVRCQCYKIRKGTRIIADGAFNNQDIVKIVVPSSVIKIGENPFKTDPYYNNRIIIENHSPSFVVKKSALYSQDLSTLIAYWGHCKHFVVPRKVKKIGGSCFANADSLENIVFPNGLELIGRKAFEDCYSLRSVDLPRSVIGIGASAFFGCELLDNVWSLGSIETIEPKTFKGCGLTFIHLPSSLKSIGDEAFNSNAELRYVELPDAVETLGDSCFAYCKKLERINLGDSIRSIGNFCFYKSSIKEIRLPSSLASLGIRPFDGIENILTKPNSVFVCKDGMLIHTKLRRLECYFGDDSSLVLNDIKSISPYAFYQSSIENVVIPESVKVISEGAFYGASKLRTISLPSQLELIETAAFCGCTNLVKLIIPETVNEIQSSSFSGCLSLKSIQFKGMNTEASELIIQHKNCDKFPSSYHSHCVTMGSFITESLTKSKVNVESMDIISIIVPRLAKCNYTFNPVFSTLGQFPMQRRFQIIESDENS